MKRTVKKVRRVGQVVTTAFIVLFIVSALSSWFVWDNYYSGLFKWKLFRAVLLGNIITSSLGALMVYLAGRR